MPTVKDIIDLINRYHGDLSRSREETREGMEEIASHVDVILDSLED